MALLTATAISQTLAKLHGNHTHRPFPTSIGKNPMLLHVSFPASIEKNPMLLHLSFPSSIEKNPPNKRIMAKSKDWSSHYNEARNQEDENICGAMAVVACVEAVHHMATGERVTLSARELVATGVQGSIRSCLAYTKVCGLSLEGPMNKGRKVFIDDYGWVKGESDTIRLLETQPAICVLALGSPKSPGDLTKYKGGIFDKPCLPFTCERMECPDYGKTIQDYCIVCGGGYDWHGLNLTGYVMEDKEKYFTVLNSWGTKWGEEGYGKIRMVGGEGLNLIAASVWYPIIRKKN